MTERPPLSWRHRRRYATLLLAPSAQGEGTRSHWARRSRSSRSIIDPVKAASRLLALSLALGACAVANTPQQDLAYERWAKCNTAYANLQYVDLDGRMTVRISNTSTAQDVVQCLAEAGRGGPPLPPPVVTRPPGGP